MLGRRGGSGLEDVWVWVLWSLRTEKKSDARMMNWDLDAVLCPAPMLVSIYLDSGQALG